MMAEAGKPFTVTDETFDQEVLNSDTPVLVDFWAEWCGPCRFVGPILDEVAKDFRGHLVVAKLNVDENPGIASRYGIRSIPTLMIFDGGDVRDTAVGALPKAQITEMVDPFIPRN